MTVPTYEAQLESQVEALEKRMKVNDDELAAATSVYEDIKDTKHRVLLNLSWTLHFMYNKHRLLKKLIKNNFIINHRQINTAKSELMVHRGDMHAMLFICHTLFPNSPSIAERLIEKYPTVRTDQSKTDEQISEIMAEYIKSFQEDEHVLWERLHETK